MTVTAIRIENSPSGVSHEEFEEIFDEHFDLVYRTVFRVVMNRHDAEDIVQEAFAVAYTNLHQFRGQANVSTWLSRIAINQAYAHLRKAKMRAGETSIEDIEHELTSQDELPDVRIESLDVQNQITRAIGRLPIHFRAVVVLVMLEEREIPEVVEILECNRATLYWRLHKARKLLRKELEQLQ